MSAAESVTPPKSITRMGLVCPHCRGTAKVRTSREITLIARDIYFRCDDIECGHVFVAQLCITGTIVRSARPNPLINLPIVPPRARPANDNGGLTPPAV